MSVYKLNSEQFLPVNMEDAWKFFSSPLNLAKITPPELSFKVLSKLDGSEIYEGMIIEYSIKPILGIPLRWKTEIGKTERNKFFVDKQLQGPYKHWEHTHTFIEEKGGVTMYDSLKYELPFGIIGDITHRLFLRRKVEQIFLFRKKVLDKLFNKNGTNAG